MPALKASTTQRKEKREREREGKRVPPVKTPTARGKEEREERKGRRNGDARLEGTNHSEEGEERKEEKRERRRVPLAKTPTAQGKEGIGKKIIGGKKEQIIDDREM